MYPTESDALLKGNQMVTARPFPEDEVLDDGTITPVWVQRRYPDLSEEAATDLARRIDLAFGSGLFRRAEERSRQRHNAFMARLTELRASGITPAEAREILNSEGYQC